MVLDSMPLYKKGERPAPYIARFRTTAGPMDLTGWVPELRWHNPATNTTTVDANACALRSAVGGEVEVIWPDALMDSTTPIIYANVWIEKDIYSYSSDDIIITLEEPAGGSV